MTPLALGPSFAGLIEGGGIALIPTDTVYGLCADAEDAVAVERLLTLKNRPAGKPAALACFSLAGALAALPELGERTQAAMRALLPGPLTLLVPNPARRFPLAGGGDLVGLRVIDAQPAPRNPILLTSANLAGEPDARSLADVGGQIRAAVDLVVDGGELPGTASTVVDLGAYEREGRWRIVRAGACSAAVLERALLGSER